MYNVAMTTPTSTVGEISRWLPSDTKRSPHSGALPSDIEQLPGIFVVDILELAENYISLLC